MFLGRRIGTDNMRDGPARGTPAHFRRAITSPLLKTHIFAPVAGCARVSTGSTGIPPG